MCLRFIFVCDFYVHCANDERAGVQRVLLSFHFQFYFYGFKLILTSQTGQQNSTLHRPSHPSQANRFIRKSRFPHAVCMTFAAITEFDSTIFIFISLFRIDTKMIAFGNQMQEIVWEREAPQREQKSGTRSSFHVSRSHRMRYEPMVWVCVRGKLLQLGSIDFIFRCFYVNIGMKNWRIRSLGGGPRARTLMEIINHKMFGSVCAIARVLI